MVTPCSDLRQFDSALGVCLYSYLGHCNDFTPNGDIFIRCVNKYIKIGTKQCLSLEKRWWGNLAYWTCHFFLIIKLKRIFAPLQVEAAGHVPWEVVADTQLPSLDT